MTADARAVCRLGFTRNTVPTTDDGHVLRPHVQVPVTLVGGGDDDVAGLQVDLNPVRRTTDGHLGVRTHLHARVVRQRDLQAVIAGGIHAHAARPDHRPANRDDDHRGRRNSPDG